MKIHYRNTLVWNLILFVMFSILLVHIATAVSLEQSSFSQDLARKTLANNKWAILLLAITGVTIYKLKKISSLLYPLAVIFVTSICISLLLVNFNKILLFLTFIYIFVAYFYYQFLQVELAEAYNNPNYYKNRLFDPMLYQIKCTLKFVSSNSNEELISGYLTNWNENGCFIILDEKIKRAGKVEVSLVMDGKEFLNTGVVVSRIHKNDGIGIKFYEEGNSIYNWDNFYKIIENKGLVPEYVG